MLRLQELLPDHLLKEAKAAADKAKGTGVQWPFGWGKKKNEKEVEAIQTPEAEVLKVNRLCIMSAFLAFLSALPCITNNMQAA